MSQSEVIACLVAGLAAYAIGATPFGYLAAKMHGVDIRKFGSGNIGATNVLRVMGKKVGIPVFILDIVKGWLPVMLTRWILAARGEPSDWPEIAAAVGTVVGHNYTFWLHFKGGKGIASSAGVLLALHPVTLAAALSLWIILFFTTRYVAVASIGASLMVSLVPLTMHLRSDDGRPALPLVGFGLLLGNLAIWRHRSNIRRLLNGTEHRFVRKSSTTPAAP